MAAMNDEREWLSLAFGLAAGVVLGYLAKVLEIIA
jgi:hypothetical protein